MLNTFKTTLLLAALTGLFLAVGGLLGGRGGVLVALVFAVVSNRDASRARLVGNPEVLASALEQLERGSARAPLPVNPSVAPLFIVNPLEGLSWSGLFSTHPPLAERVRRPRAMDSGTAA